MVKISPRSLLYICINYLKIAPKIQHFVLINLYTLFLLSKLLQNLILGVTGKLSALNCFLLSISN